MSLPEMDRVAPSRAAMTGRRRAAFFLTPALLFFCGFAAAAEASWSDQLNQAEQLSKEGKNEESAAAAEGALAAAEKILGPDAPEIGHILSRLSHIYDATGTSARLPEMESRLSAVKSKDLKVWFALGKTLREEGKSLEAEDALKQALALNPDDPAAEGELAQVYDDMGRFEEEIPLLNKKIAKEPQDYFSYSRLARTYTRLGRSAEAEATFAQAKKSDGGKTADAYIKAGYFYLSSGESAQAKAAFESAIAVDTASPRGYHHMGAYLMSVKQYSEAEKNLRRAREMLEADPNAPADELSHTLQWLGNVVEAEGRSAEAEAVYLKALEKTRSGGDLQLNLLHTLAHLYVSQGKNAQAEETYKRAAAACEVRFNCRFLLAGTALVGLGQFYLDQGRGAEAAAVAQRAEKASEDIPLGQGFVELKNFAAFYVKLGDASKAAALYARLMPLRRTMPFNPDLVWVEKGLADMNAAQGRLPEAEDFYRQAIGILEHNGSWKEEAGALGSLAAIERKDGKPVEAQEAMKKAKSLGTRVPADP